MNQALLRKEAEAADQRISALYSRLENSWVMLGIEVIKFRDANYHTALGFSRFDDWAVKRFSKSKSTIYAMVRRVRELETGIPIHEIEKMTAENAESLLELPIPKRYDPELVKKAQEMTATEFWDCVKEAGGQWITRERKRVVPFHVDNSLAEVIERVTQLAMEEQETDSRTKAIEAIFVHYELCEHRKDEKGN